MDNFTTLRTVHRTLSTVLLIKGLVGGAFAALTLAGVTLPFFGIESTPLREASAASVGGVAGIILALKT